MIGAVVFDVGECLVDESREYGAWADWLGVPRHTFSAVLGAVVARGQDPRVALQAFRPGWDLAAEGERRAAAGEPERIEEGDLYPDVRQALTRLAADGYWIGIAGNQTVRAITSLRGLGLTADLVAASDEWGVAKPDPAFFATLAGLLPCAPADALYVGDRLDNDIRPATLAGFRTAMIRRGPWGVLHWDEPDARRLPSMRVTSLTELCERLGPAA